MATTNRRAMTLPECAEALGIGRRTAYDLAARGEFPVRVIRLGTGPRARLRVSRQEFERWLAGDDGRDAEDAALNAAVDELLGEGGMKNGAR